MLANPTEDVISGLLIVETALLDRASLGNEFLDIEPLGRLVRLGVRCQVTVDRVVSRLGNLIDSKATQRAIVFDPFLKDFLRIFPRIRICAIFTNFRAAAKDFRNSALGSACRLNSRAYNQERLRTCPVPHEK